MNGGILFMKEKNKFYVEEIDNNGNLYKHSTRSSNLYIYASNGFFCILFR